MFDPRIKPKDGQNLDDMKIIWQEENVKIAYESYEQGLPLSIKPWITGLPLVRRAGLNYAWNDWELSEAMKCSQSIIYFAENYCHLLMPDSTYQLVKLFPYQRKILDAYQNNRYLIMLASRQMGKTTTTAICLLWTLLFGQNAKIALLGDKHATAIENLEKIKAIYYRLPFFLKPGAVGWNKGGLAFDNGNSIFGGACTLGTIVGKTITVLYFDELAIPDDSVSRAVVEFAFPTISALQDSKIVATSSPRGDNIFKELWLGSQAGTNAFTGIRIDWWERPGRDEKWKQEQIGLLGSEKAFEQQYGNKFLTNVTEWLDESVFDKMDESIKQANWVTLGSMLAEKPEYQQLAYKLSLVENTIRRSNFKDVEKRPIAKKLLDRTFVNRGLVKDIEDLTLQNLLITIDTAEGKLNDSTIVNGLRIVLTEDAMKKFEQANDGDFDFSDNESFEDDNEFGVVEELGSDTTTDFEISLFTRCEQCFLIDTNEHTPAMVALFLQMLVYYKIFNYERIKLVCERDGIGNSMQMLLQSDILENSGIDTECFGSFDNKNLGIYMRGNRKSQYVDITKSILEDFRLLPTHPVSQYELARFGQVKKSYQGIDCHDDHSMSFVIAGAFMTSSDFMEFVENVISPDSENNDNDDNLDFDMFY